MSSEPRGLARRPARAIPTTILALALLALGGLAAWLIGARLVDGEWPPQAQDVIDEVATTRLDSTPALLLAIALAVIGLVLLLAAFKPGKPSRSEVRSDGVPGETVVPNRDLARLVRSRTRHVEGLQDTTVRVTSRRIDVVATALGDDTDRVRDDVSTAAEKAVADLQPDRPLPARVRVRQTT
ncbi:hypothetical protein BCF74_11236 [Knoellia remsis]|uniref:DUF6286 domain-containing protein n=1 Tax=Knoellia remsis TaxID=407159 RepID=A0A2T0UJU7_9MICO|nr:DUF6286 domain-containing protein [Knoellia remsis]PRY58219.1 hypothetical protein BCF74_11236 [Knoellia remsis]